MTPEDLRTPVCGQTVKQNAEIRSSFVFFATAYLFREHSLDSATELTVSCDLTFAWREYAGFYTLSSQQHIHSVNAQVHECLLCNVNAASAPGACYNDISVKSCTCSNGFESVEEDGKQICRIESVRCDAGRRCGHILASSVLQYRHPVGFPTAHSCVRFRRTRDVDSGLPFADRVPGTTPGRRRTRVRHSR